MFVHAMLRGGQLAGNRLGKTLWVSQGTVDKLRAAAGLPMIRPRQRSKECRHGRE